MRRYLVFLCLLGGCASAPRHAQTSPSSNSPFAMGRSQGNIANLHQDVTNAESELVRRIDRSDNESQSMVSDEVCESACSLSERICELAEKICELAGQTPGDAAAQTMCADDRTRCDKNRERVAAECQCPQK